VIGRITLPLGKVDVMSTKALTGGGSTGPEPFELPPDWPAL